MPFHRILIPNLQTPRVSSAVDVFYFDGTVAEFAPQDQQCAYRLKKANELSRQRVM